ncbi:MAG: hypothetical protein K5898_03175 [Ruminococcus sp.]|uniref:hypothetical protein n=1 Tax=Ruminococcus sp. TaxID=41978 RepID=UPI0025D89735|nr:hypothetical protein [Ruminococcus sp.]MCR4794169.1 hypothetical protein [Ruminococcus sp.]
MKLVNSVISLAAAVTLVPACVCLYAEADYEAPSNIEVSVGSFEIDRSQLSGDTLVEVPVYINNNCGFVSLNILFSLDGRLRFAGDYEAEARARNLSGVNIYNCADNTISACFEASGRKKVTDNGELGVLRVNIPENTPAGEYGISMPDSAGDFEVMIFTHNSDEALFGRECFSALNGGRITVTDNSHTRTADDTDINNNEDNNNSQQSAEDTADNGDNSSAAAVTTTETTTTSSTSTTVKTTTTSAATSAAAISETSAKASAAAVTEAQVSEKVTERSEKGKKRNMLAPILAASLLLVGAAVAFVVKKGGKSK